MRVSLYQPVGQGLKNKLLPDVDEDSKGKGLDQQIDSQLLTVKVDQLEYLPVSLLNKSCQYVIG